MARAPSRSNNVGWTFLTNHAFVLLCIARNPGARIREISLAVGITERAVQRIIAELEASGYLAHDREGRRNLYEVQRKREFRHPIAQHCDVEALLKFVLGSSKRAPKPRTRGKRAASRG